MAKVAMLSKWHVHAPGYAKSVIENGSEITCVWDEDPQRGQKWADELGADFVPCLDELLARTDVDAVVVDTPTSMHYEVIMKAAKAGKHIFTEKTLAPTVAQCLEIKKAIEDNQVKFTISFPQRTYPSVQYAKQVLDSGELGTVSLVRLRNAHSGASANWLPDYWYIEKDACGGSMMDLGCHPMYISAYLLGKPVRISSMYNDITGHGVDDNAVNLIEFANKAVAVVETGFVTPYTPWAFEIYGTEGALLATDQKVRLISAETRKYTDQYIEVTNLPKELPMPITSFLHAVDYGTPVDFGIEDAIDLARLLENAYLAHSAGKTVEIR